MTIDEILSHLSDEDANVVQRAISSLCGMITIRDKYIKYPAVELEVCYSNLESNKMYDEELDEDGYPILVFVGRCNSL